MDKAEELRDYYRQLKSRETHQNEFFIALALGLLAFSIERFDSHAGLKWIPLMEAAWISLLISAIFGICNLQFWLKIDATVYHARMSHEGLARNLNFGALRASKRFFTLAKVQMYSLYLGLFMLGAFKIFNTR